MDEEFGWFVEDFDETFSLKKGHISLGMNKDFAKMFLCCFAGLNDVGNPARVPDNNQPQAWAYIPAVAEYSPQSGTLRIFLRYVG